MIPLLYRHDSLGCPDQENGFVGRLRDAVSCYIYEEVNSKYELELTYPVDGYLSDYIKVGNYIYAYYKQAWTDATTAYHPLTGKMQFFRIYKISRHLHGTMTIYGEHLSYLLNDVLVAVDPSKIDRSSAAVKYTASDMIKPDDSGTTLCGGKIQIKAGADILKRFSTPVYDLQATDDGHDDIYVSMRQKTYTYSQLPLFPSGKPYTYRSLMSGQEGSMIDKFGGFFAADNYKIYYFHDVDVTKSHNTINLRYGRNLSNCTYDIDTTSIVGSVIGYVYDQETDKTTYSEVVNVPQTAKIASRHAIYADVSDIYTDRNGTVEAGSTPTYSVTDCTRIYVSQRIQSGEYTLLPESLTVETERVHGEDNIQIMLPVKVMLPDYGITIDTSVRSLKYDVLMERVESYEIGKKQRKIADYVG